MTVNTYTRNTRPSEYALPYIQNVLGGNYLPGNPNGNPYLDQTFDMAALRTQNQLSSEFARGGRNVEASQPIRSQQLGDLATQIYGGAYDAERNRQNSIVPYAGNDTVSTSPLHRDRVGELLGGLMLGGELLGSYGDLYDRFFGDEAGGGASGDAQGQGGGSAGAAGAAAGVLGGGLGSIGGGAGSAVPGGSVTITDGAGNVIPSVGSGGDAAGAVSGGLGAAGALGSAVGGASSGVAGGGAIGSGILGSSGAGVATGGGAAAAGAGAAGAAGGTSALGLGAAGLFALPIALGMAGVYGDPRHDETSQLGRAYDGLGMHSVNTQWGQELLRLPNGEYIDAESVKHTLDDRWGKEPAETTLSWLMSQPRVQYSPPQLGRRRVGPNAPIADYR
jgi:hypothetical protein